MRMFRFCIALLVGTFGAASMAHAANYLVFGGTSGCGLETVKLLRGAGHEVTAFVRPTSNLEGLEPLGVTYVVGNVLNKEDVDTAFASGSFDAVISSLGGRPGEPRPDYVGNKHIADAAQASGIARYIQVSAIGVDQAPTEKPEPSNYMGNVMYEKKRGDDYVINGPLDFTIIRPGGLLDGPPTGNGKLLAREDTTGGTIMRSDVAALVVAVLNDPETVGQVYNVIDPELKDSRIGADAINRQVQEQAE